MKYLLFFCLLSCAQVTSLNLKEHQFGVQPRKIIWIQIAGLDEEHLALLKFDENSSLATTNFERFSCYGKAWQYNLFKIRPSAKLSFISQITGSSNVTNTCNDYKAKPVWSFLDEQGYSSAIFETPNSTDQSLSDNKCPDQKSFTKGASLFSMNKAKEENYFHLEKKESYDKDSVYYDKSCSTGDCFTKISKNIVGTFRKVSKNKTKLLYLVRDFSYLNRLNQGNIIGAREVLNELDRSISAFFEYAKDNKDALVLVSTAGASNVEFPQKGSEWESYLKKGRYVKNKNTKLISSVFAYGARSENFCGLYEQKDLLLRMFSGPKQQGLKLKFINPFN